MAVTNERLDHLEATAITMAKLLEDGAKLQGDILHMLRIVTEKAITLEGKVARLEGELRVARH